MPIDPRRLLEALAGEKVDFVIVGGVAFVLHGSTRVTRDLDICYSRSAENLARLAKALAPLHPTLRHAPPSLPFRLDASTLRSGLNFTLTTDAGDLDLLGEITGVGGFGEIARGSASMEIYGLPVRVMGLDDVERAKRAAGRLKDLADLAELLEIRRRRGE
jgi:hypothetical protein